MPGLFHRARHEAAYGVLLPSMVRMISARVAPFLRCSMATTWAVLLPCRGAVILGAPAVFLAGGTFLAAVALWVAAPLTGALLAARAPPLAWRAAFGWAAWASGRTG